MNRHSACLFAILLALGVSQAHAAICRVATDGIASNDGSDWTLTTTLQDALANGNGKTCDEIWVKAGVYKPVVPAAATPTTAEREVAFTIDRPLFLYGGFAGGENSLSERVPNPANRSVLSGDIDSNDVDPDGNQIAEDFSQLAGANSFHVVAIGGLAASGEFTPANTVIDGFTITAGDSGGTLPAGGGLFCISPSVGSRCGPSLSQLQFSGNRATGGSGGALGVFAVSGGIADPVLTRVRFSGNSAQNGGAMAITAQGGTSQPVLSQVSFSGNVGGQFGGAFAHTCASAICTAELTNVTFSANQALSGGAIASIDAPLTLTHVTLSGNRATDTTFGGGAILSLAQAGSAHVTLRNTLLWGNTAPPPMPPLGPSAQILSVDVNSTDPGNNAGLSFLGSLMEPNGCSTVNVAPLPVVAQCSTTGVIATDPKLGALADNGGGTSSHVPGAAAGAIDAGDAGVCASLNPSIDQRGVSRPQGAGCDIGAVERSICRVATDGVAANDGSSWASATTLQDALANGNGKGCDEIWVKAGLYKPTTSSDRSLSFAIDRPVGLFGGFAGVEASLAARVMSSANRSILSGDIDDNDVNADGNHIAESVADIVGSNSYHVLVIGGRNPANGSGVYGPSDVVIDGFSVTAGLANGPAPDDGGAGLWCNGAGTGRECSPSLSHVTFSGNQASFGGAMFNHGSSGRSSPTLTQSTLSGNQAQFGGALYNYGFNGVSSPVLTHVTLSANQATDSGGAIYSVGSSGASNLELRNSLLWGNGATDTGPEIANADASTAMTGSLMPAGGCAVEVAGSCPVAGFISTDPQLGPLADNGGSTLTHLPGSSGGAYEAGDGSVCAALDRSVDQRGVVRPQFASCDIGAVELRAGNFLLFVFVQGGGSVSESGSLLRIDNCSGSGGTCSHNATVESEILLAATPAANFVGWDGECSGSDANFRLTLDSDKVCIARFSRDQSITFDPQASPLGFASGRSFALNPTATASSGLAVAYASTTPAVCSIIGSSVTMLSPGTCTIEASQSGGGNHDAASPVTQSVELVLRTVTGSAGSGGSVSPPSQQLEDGATAQLTVTPDPGFAIDSASGCGGALDLGSGLYTTAAVTADCTVAASFVPNLMPTVAFGSLPPLGDAEGNGGVRTLAIPLTLDATSASVASVDYSLSPAAGSAGVVAEDFQGATSGSVSFAPGVTSATLTLEISADDLVEPDEAFALDFGNPQNVALSTAVSSGLSITLGNDDEAVLSLGTPTQPENAGPLAFEAQLDHPVQGGVTLDWITVDGTAKAGQDFQTAFGQDVAIGTLSTALQVPLIDDAEVEANESLRLESSARCAFSPCALSVQGGIGTIQDDEPGAAGLAVFIDNGTLTSDPDDRPTWQVSVLNRSAETAFGAILQLPLPPALAEASWSCQISGGGDCSVSQGEGEVELTLNLPGGTQADISFTATVGQFTSTLDVTATVTTPAGYIDDDAGDDTATDSDRRRTILRDGFESP